MSLDKQWNNKDKQYPWLKSNQINGPFNVKMKMKSQFLQTYFFKFLTIYCEYFQSDGGVEKLEVCILIIAYLGMCWR